MKFEPKLITQKQKENLLSLCETGKIDIPKILRLTIQRPVATISQLTFREARTLENALLASLETSREADSSSNKK